MNTLANKALLVTLNISQWAARKLDKAESAAVEARNRTVTGAARVNKSLLPMAFSLDKVHKLTGAIRTEFYRLTLPWAEGMAIIKADAYLDFTKRMSERKVEWDKAVAKFIEEYPDLREDAKHLLGDLYKDEDYPDPSELAQRFRMEMAFFPVPDASDWRVSLGDAEVEQLRQQVTEKVMESEGKAMREAWQRVHEVVAKAHDRLSDPGNIFRDSLIENARDLCQLLPMLNITDDPELEKMRRTLEQGLCQYEPQDLRDDEDLRASVSDELAEIMRKMGGYM